MRIDQTPDFLESVANHPRVFPYVTVRGVDVIKFAPIWHDCIAVVFDTGGWLFHRQADPDVYEVHTLFLPKSTDVLAKAAAAKHFIFDQMHAKRLETLVAIDLPHVRRLALRSGFKLTHRITGMWPRESGPIDYDHFEITRESWETKGD